MQSVSKQRRRLNLRLHCIFTWIDDVCMNASGDKRTMRSKTNMYQSVGCLIFVVVGKQWTKRISIASFGLNKVKRENIQKRSGQNEIMMLNIMRAQIDLHEIIRFYFIYQRKSLIPSSVYSWSACFSVEKVKFLFY